MRKVDVVCGVVLHNNKILICQKGDGPSKDKWEFPGGKVNIGESCTSSSSSGQMPNNISDQTFSDYYGSNSLLFWKTYYHLLEARL